MFGEDIKIVSENEFTKHFKWESKNINCYFSKSYEEETDKHFMVFSIPEIEELGVMHIQEAFAFESETERNDYFQIFGIDLAKEFLQSLIDRIKEKIEKAKEQDQIEKKEDEFNGPSAGY